MRTVLFLALILGALSFNIQVQSDNDDKVKVDFYYESLCPYCQQFMQGALTKAANTKVNQTPNRISGKFASLPSLPTATPNGHGTGQPGLLLASMELESARAT